jgi:hypothetical protein
MNYIECSLYRIEERGLSAASKPKAGFAWLGRTGDAGLFAWAAKQMVKIDNKRRGKEERLKKRDRITKGWRKLAKRGGMGWLRRLQRSFKLE